MAGMHFNTEASPRKFLSQIEPTLGYHMQRDEITLRGWNYSTLVIGMSQAFCQARVAFVPKGSSSELLPCQIYKVSSSRVYSSLRRLYSDNCTTVCSRNSRRIYLLHFRYKLDEYVRRGVACMMGKHGDHTFNRQRQASPCILPRYAGRGQLVESIPDVCMQLQIS